MILMKRTLRETLKRFKGGGLVPPSQPRRRLNENQKNKPKGFDYYLEINGKDIDAIADVWTGGEYIGQLEKLISTGA